MPASMPISTSKQTYSFTSSFQGMLHLLLTLGTEHKVRYGNQETYG
jgi:hypothetical protein